MGNLAHHLSSENVKIYQIANQLIDSLRTPSESVQKTISNCLISLSPLIQNNIETFLNQLLTRLQFGETYADRRGAAFGIAGIVKGLGLQSLKKYNIISTLQSAIEDKKHSTARQGALFAFECLSLTLQKLFEPYVIQILPKLLVCFGDSVSDVRDATSDTAKAIMSQLSSHGIKLVLPALLKALEDKSWRTKIGK